VQSSSPSVISSNGGGGGERVRLCNPCVPDPNTAPPQSPRHQTHLHPPLPRSHGRSTSLSSTSSNHSTPQELSDEGDGRRSYNIGGPISYRDRLYERSMQNQARRSTISSTSSNSSSHLQGNASSTNQNRGDGPSRGPSEVGFKPFLNGSSS
jgi:hypothetical protein